MVHPHWCGHRDPQASVRVWRTATLAARRAGKPGQSSWKTVWQGYKRVRWSGKNKVLSKSWSWMLRTALKELSVSSLRGRKPKEILLSCEKGLKCWVMPKKEWGAESCCDRWIRRPWHWVKEKRQRPQIVYSIYMKFPKTTNERKWIGCFQSLGRQGIGLVSPRHTGNGKWVPQVTSPGEMMYRSQNKTETVVVQLCKSTKSPMFTWEGFILRYLKHMEMSGFFFFTPTNPSPSYNTTQDRS